MCLFMPSGEFTKFKIITLDCYQRYNVLASDFSPF